MKIKSNLIVCLLTVTLVMGISTQAFAATYTIDVPHSSIAFTVKHLQVSKTRGQFNDFSGTITLDQNDPSVFDADVTIQAASIDTANEKRDEHLRSDDFLGSESFPNITFKGKSIVYDGEEAIVTGDLTIRDVTKEITVPMELSGPVEGMQGGKVIGLSGETVIDRQDFGVSWSKNLDKGGLVVSNDVKLLIDIEAHAE